MVFSGGSKSQSDYPLKAESREGKFPASTNLHASLQVQGASFLQLFLVGKSGVVGGSQGVVTS